MVHNTDGIVLRSIKYGDSSFITTIFTSLYGVQTYMAQGVRSTKAGKNRGSFFQPGTLLELVVYQQPQKNMQRIREFQAAYIYTTLHEDVIRNSVLLFSVELLLRLLPEHAPLPVLFNFSLAYFKALDIAPVAHVANFPLYFVIQCSRELGYELKGEYSTETPYLNLQDGAFTEHPPATIPFASDEDARIMSRLLAATDVATFNTTEMNGTTRLRLIDWYVAFLQQHTQHMGSIRSLSVLRAILY
jgi:DNA repair protein RecO (recombination protein O)